MTERILETQIDCYNKKFADLGIEETEDHQWFPCAIDLTKFVAVKPLVELNGDIDESITILYTYDMDTLTIKESYPDILARWKTLINQ
jgi:hypothetical protein